MILTHHHLPARSGRTHSLVILLHGFGSDGASMLWLAQALSIALPDTAFIAPDAPWGGTGGRMWYTIPELDGSSAEEAESRLQASARHLDAFIDDQLAQAGVPPSALALLGFSQGAGMCYEVAPRRPERLAGVVAIAGRMKRKDALASEARTAPPFLILTGARDELLNQDEPRAALSTLSKVGIMASHVTMADAGHGISDSGLIAAQDFLKLALTA